MDGNNCGFEWVYSIALNSEFVLGFYQLTDFVQLSSDQTQILFKGPENAVAQNGTVSIIG